MPWLPSLPATAQLTLTRCDASSRQEMAALSTRLRSTGLLRSVMHAGGVIQDAALASQSAASLRAALAPKAGTAACLAASTFAQPLAGTTAFSSLSGLLGTPGQANYAAANSALDALAEHSQAAGAFLPLLEYKSVFPL